MLGAMVGPLLVTTVLAASVVALHRRLPPALAARATAVSMAVIAASALPTIWITAIGYLSHAPVVGHWLIRCAHALGAHDEVGPYVGIPAVVISVVGAVKAIGTVRAYRALRHQHQGGVHIADEQALFVFTVPGRAGRIVMSQGLHDALDDEERQVVLAHERAHAAHRHDRYLLAAQLAADLLAPLRPIVRRLQFSLERWADEVAVASCGDRRFVARTLGRVALCAADAQPALAFAGLGVPARMSALLSPPVASPRAGWRAAMWGLIAVSAVFAGFQWGHLAEMLLTLCPD